MTYHTPLDETQHQIEDLTGLVAQIVEMKASQRNLEAQKNLLQQQVNEITTQIMRINKEIREQRKLLDHCLDTGEDLTTVKLTKDSDELDAKGLLMTSKSILMEDMKKYSNTWHPENTNNW